MIRPKNKTKAPRNRTIVLNDVDIKKYSTQLVYPKGTILAGDLRDKTLCHDTHEALVFLPNNFVDLVVVDPPYNLSKKFNAASFKEMESDHYEEWLDSWVSKILRLLKPTASVYICGDWKSSGAIFNVAKKYFKIRNRITWEREKGRGADTNWKNCSEDIWFCTVGDEYVFNVDAVKMKRKVIAPYKDENGKPKDWTDEGDEKYRITHPSNMWTDLTIPFWSMPENTEHPTQKPEKLIAKIILAGSNPGDLVFDPFLGSGTTSVVAKKLGRQYLGIEIDPYYCCVAEKRLDLANADKTIQGYSGGVFWERNTGGEQSNGNKKNLSLFNRQLL